MDFIKPTTKRKAIRDRHFHFGSDPVILALLQEAERVAKRNTPILLEGETGTGKSLVVRKIHELSHRKGSFISINCASFSSNLLESELFGHAKGAFTGAKEARQGLVNAAEHGTLFLDEVGELPLELQPKLLHLLEEKTFRAVGSDVEQLVSARIISATNCDLKKLVNDGKFRADLYYRLSVIPFKVPPLRERTADIQGLTKSFINELCEEHTLQQPALSQHCIDSLSQYPWPGNVRELRNHIERALLLDLSLEKPLTINQQASPNDSWPTLDKHEKLHINRTLEFNSGNKSKSALMLGISRRTLDRKLKRWQNDAA